MELFQAKDHYILQQGERALWCSRRDGGLELRPGEAAARGHPGRGARAAAGGRGRGPAGAEGAACGPGGRAGGRLGEGARCPTFPTEGARLAPGPRPRLRADKGPSFLRGGEGRPGVRQPGSGRLSREVRARDPAAKASSFRSGLWPGPRDRVWVRTPVSGSSDPSSAARAAEPRSLSTCFWVLFKGCPRAPGLKLLFFGRGVAMKPSRHVEL